MSYAVLEGGCYYHHESIHGARFRGRFARSIYTPELQPEDLRGFSAVLVADRIHPAVLRRQRRVLIEYLAGGGTLIVLGENCAQQWAPQVQWEFRPTNFWWWLDKKADPGLRIAAPDHPMLRFVAPRDFVWHYHGLLHVPEGATAVTEIAPAADPEGRGGALLYDHPHVAGSAGRLVVATLDPFYHHGSFFMPAATRFLAGLLDWMDHEFGGAGTETAEG